MFYHATNSWRKEGEFTHFADEKTQVKREIKVKIKVNMTNQEPNLLLKKTLIIGVTIIFGLLTKYFMGN